MSSTGGTSNDIKLSMIDKLKVASDPKPLWKNEKAYEGPLRAFSTLH